MNNHTQLKHVTSALVDFDTVMPSMEALVLAYLATHPKVTFIDLEDDVPGFPGDLDFVSSFNRQTILWRGVSSCGVHALHELDRQGKIEFKLTSSRTCQLKGRRLRLPIDEWDSDIRHWTPALVGLKVKTH